ncbi:MAG: DNA polymerase I [Oscillospiraceae bacterium]|nr:DNA polymerase I [Oscillospiraceae bacterium]
MKKLLIIDGNSIMNRAFYGIKPLTTSDGLYTNAVYGFVNIIKKHLDSINPNYAACAFDLREKTFRHEMYTEYKATRKGMPEELAMQVEYVRAAAAALGLNILTKAGYEADDILGTAADVCEREQSDIMAYIVTGDRDSLQLVSDKVTIILATTSSDEKYTPEDIKARYGIESKQLIDVKALMGDTSDNIPGVKGIGEKTALKLIGECGSLDSVYGNLETVQVSQSVKAKLSDGKESAYMSRKLAEICRCVPGFPPLDELKRKDIDRPELKKLFTKLEFFKLIKTFSLEDISENTFTSGPDSVLPAERQISLDDNNLCQPAPAEITIAEAISAESLRALREKSDIIYLFYDSAETESMPYLSVGGRIYRIESKDILKELINLEPVVLSYKDYCHYYAGKIDSDISKLSVKFDLSLAQYIINPADNAATPQKLAFIYLGRTIPKAAEHDAFLMLSIMEPLYTALSKKLSESGAQKLYFDIELPLSRVLAKAELVGFKVNSDGLKEYGRILTEQTAVIEKKIYEEAGQTFNINSPKQLGYILFEVLNLPHGKKTKTGFSTGADILDELRGLSPVVSDILEFRKLSKLLNTYALGLLKVISPSDGRIHTSFNQTLTMTGRLSSTEPNLQNIPVKTEEGRELRRFFIPQDESHLLIDADYSQIELRILACISDDENMKKAFRDGNDIHTQTASEIFHVPQCAVTPAMRKNAKAVNFGIVYGIGEFSLSKDIGVSMKTAKDYIDRYFDTYPKVRSYLDNTVADAKRNGFVKTLFGRVRYIQELSAKNKNTASFGARVAMNTPIQGTAADIIKLAMVNVDRRLEREGLRSRLILQVHDELIIEAPKSEAEYVKKLLKEEMENAVSFDVALTADVGIGENWLDAK